MRRKLEEPIKDWMQATFNQPLLIQGARQVGKTALAEHIGKSFFEKGYINKKNGPFC